ncbi:alpha beta hydrolase [Fusarium albosuccineum]|uniref:Alpha beta hydrolase n=1 Tax=Fusarium albosuccineum TaxID=1237068 RepID=A0A8H4L7D4_9HYPO|nr:alpha beta hydrolase [Fusarium albosuccineum]
MRHRRYPAFPSAEETLKHPAFPATIWALEPHRKGKALVAKERGGPVGIAWEVHGDGPIKLVLLMGLAGVKTSWQRQTKYFGHDRGDKYSVLILDNRGMGGSDKPYGLYSTSEMALDVIEVLDHVGWTSDREINLVGISMGGMIAQEMALRIPKRLQSLSLLCTSAAVNNAKSFTATVAEGMGFLIPKSTERSIADTARQLFTAEWLAAPDAEMLPEPGVTPGCGPPPPEVGPTYRLFDSNFQRFQAQELAKRREPGEFLTRAFLSQLSAAALHHKSDEQLHKIAEAVGRERILVMHGMRDNMITVPNGERLVRALRPGVSLIEDGMGHAPVMERTQWFNSVMEERLGMWSKIIDE